MFPISYRCLNNTEVSVGSNSSIMYELTVGLLCTAKIILKFQLGPIHLLCTMLTAEIIRKFHCCLYFIYCVRAHFRSIVSCLNNKEVSVGSNSSIVYDVNYDLLLFHYRPM